MIQLIHRERLRVLCVKDGLGDGGQGAGEDEHADMVAKHGIAGLGLPVWGRAFAG